MLCLYSCKKESYLTDEGVHEARVNLTTYDYLAQHPAGLFDTLIIVIDHFGLKDEINNASTFFAPTNYSIKRFYNRKWAELLIRDENATYSLAQMLEAVNVDSLRTYIYNDGNHGPTTANTQYTPIANASGIPGFSYHRQLQPPGQWSFQPIYYLYYVQIRGEQDQVNSDGVVTTPEGDETDLRIRCQTSGIITSTGTVINVLANSHNFIADFYPPLSVQNSTWNYDVAFPFDAANYSGASVSIDQNELATAFGLEASEIPDLLGNTIKFYAVESNGELNATTTANGYGHWFDANGNVINWGADARLFCEYDEANFTFNIGQFPGQTAAGNEYTIKQAMAYEAGFEMIRVTFVFNITIE